MTGEAKRRVLVLGATGTIGHAVTAALDGRDIRAVCPVRSDPDPALPSGATIVRGDVTAAGTVARILDTGRVDAVVCCLASRTGTPKDALAVDHRATADAIAATEAAGVRCFVLLSAICVQKPRLAFQHAKLAAEEALRQSGIPHWSIVRPTAYFKSLSGQVARVRDGKPFLLFGDGQLTACKPISDRDLARYLADCIDDPSRHGKTLPLGGPGAALTPREQVAILERLLGRDVPTKSVSPGFLMGIARALDALGAVVPPLKTKAALARIGHYYATESMLVWDTAAQRYDAAATPSFGEDTLADHYAALLGHRHSAQLGAHAVFDRAGG